MRLIRCLLFFNRAFARILTLQQCGDGENFRQRVFIDGGQNHAADARIDGQHCHAATDLGHLTFGRDGSKFFERLVAFPHCGRTRRIKERKFFDVSKSQIDRTKNHGCEICPLNLRSGKCFAAVEVFLAVQTNADAGAHTSATPGSLIG